MQTKSNAKKIAELEAMHEAVKKERKEKELAAKQKVKKQTAAKEKKITEKIKRLKSKVSEQKRKDDTRLKILVGATVLNSIEGKGDESKTKAWLARELDKYMTEDRDRKLVEHLLPKKS